MMTQTHILVSVALLGRPGNARKHAPRNAMAIAGGIVPDAAIYVLYAIEKLKGTPEATIWRDVYFSPFWQDVVAWGNSFPLFLLVLAVGFCWMKRGPIVSILLQTTERLSFSGNTAGDEYRFDAGKLLCVFAISCLVHLAMDFPVHVDDAHRHFYPLSDFRFRSPVSYWDPRHHGVAFSIFEAITGIVLSVILWRRFESWLARGGIVLFAMAYLLLPVYFVMSALQFIP